MTPTRQPRPPIPESDPLVQRRRFIDFSMPLPWIIGMFLSGVAGLFYIGGMAADQRNLLRQIVESQVKIERKQDEISVRADTLRDSVTELKQAHAVLSIRVGTIERDRSK